LSDDLTPITQTQLESYLWGAATLLRGLIDAGDYKQFIFPLFFFKRLCDVYDEESAQLREEFGEDVDAPWTNKDRLPDRPLRDLIEHFSTLTLSVANVSEDLLGQAYEYLTKKFADDSGYTAAEFYTNRTVVHLMTLLVNPQPGESIYDPTCGSGGMLLSAVAELERQGQEYRNLQLYGQERNLMTSAIARMNLFLHGIEDFHVERGDTLADPWARWPISTSDPRPSLPRQSDSADPTHWWIRPFGTVGGAACPIWASTTSWWRG